MFRNLRRALQVSAILVLLGVAALCYLNPHWFDPLRDIVWIWKNRSVPTLAPTRWTGQITEVLDGRTFYFRATNGSIYRVKLFGLQMPVKSTVSQTANGPRERGKEALRALGLSNRVNADFMASPINRHVEAVVYLGETNVNRVLVATGQAKVDRSKILALSGRETYRWLATERKARRKRVGLWMESGANTGR